MRAFNALRISEALRGSGVVALRCASGAAAPSLPATAKQRLEEVRLPVQFPHVKQRMDLSLDEALYLAKEAGYWTTQEVQLQIVRSPPFSPRERPMMLENFFDVADSAVVFRAEVNRTGGGTLGLDLNSDTLRVQRIAERSLIAAWNKDEPSKAIRVNDVVVEVNGCSGAEQIAAELDKKVPLEITLARPREGNAFSRAEDDAVLDEGEAIDEETAGDAHPVIHATLQRTFRPGEAPRFVHAGQEWLAEAEGKGTRKRASAHVVIRRGSGLFKVNGESDIYSRWPLIYHRFDVLQPFKLTGTACAFDVFVEVRGSGAGGQAGATRLAVARALLTANPGCHDDLQRGFCLLEDTRQKMSKMPGKANRRASYGWNKR